MIALTPDTAGDLHFRTFPIEELGGVIEHWETMTYRGACEGKECFQDCEGRKIYLHPDEIVTFDPVDA